MKLPLYFGIRFFPNNNVQNIDGTVWLWYHYKSKIYQLESKYAKLHWLLINKTVAKIFNNEAPITHGASF